MNLMLIAKYSLLALTLMNTNETDDNAIFVKQESEIKYEEVVDNHIEVEATFYGPDCKGCSGITKVGYNVKNTIYVKGMRVIAVDPKLIPLHSIVKVELEDGQVFKALAADTGGDIKGNRIDVLVSSEKESFNYGRQKAKITILGVDK